VDLGINKDESIGSPSVPSSPLSDSLSLLANNKSASGSSGKGPFACDQCGLTFTRRDELEKHETSHPTPNQVRIILYVVFYVDC
jgi:hypothetical protein